MTGRSRLSLNPDREAPAGSSARLATYPMLAIAALCILGGCATDPRRSALHEEVVRLRGEYLREQISEEEARRLLDAKAAELFGPDTKFCETYYPRSFSRYPSTFDGFGYPRRWNIQRTFPGCYLEDTTAASPPLIIRNPVLRQEEKQHQ
jgi:hypothetical protein